VRLVLIAPVLAGVVLVLAGRDGPAERAPVSASTRVEGGGRSIPVGLSVLANSTLSANRYVAATRFVLDRPTTVYRFFDNFALDGARGVFSSAGSDGYGRGDGGTAFARLVEVKRNGEPDLRRVLAHETFNAARRFAQTKAAYGLDDAGGARRATHLLHINLGGVRLRANRMYAMTYQNVHPRPTSNFFSVNHPTVKESEAGPNGRNTTSARARGAIAGLDPREAVGWSRTRGHTWTWGRRVGGGSTFGSYEGDPNGDQGTRLPWYGWQRSPAYQPESNQPYYAYGQRGAFRLVAHDVPRRTTLTQAGGYAPVGANVGTVTVRNLTTGRTGRTATLGSGIARGPLRPPVTVRRGDSYAISNTGTVFKAEADTFILRIFHVGTIRGLSNGSWPFTTDGHLADRAELFALPHPWFARR
jgi:hypothetical protein